MNKSIKNSMPKFRKNLLRVNDTVKQQTGRLMSFNRKTGKVKVESKNMKVHFSKENGMTKSEGEMHVSKVMYYDEENLKRARLTRDSEGKRIVKEKKNVSR